MLIFTPNPLSHLRLHKQRGAVLMVMLVILIIGATAMLVSSLNSVTPQLARDKNSSDALAQAKEALIGYAITYSDTHTNVNGFLPCPDQGQNITQDGTANSSCAVTDISAIGKLPWKSLGLPPLRDGSGECLWYAVSGTYKNSPDTDLMNWDNNGLFQIMATDGVSFLAGSSADNQPVAVIFAPGPPMGAQSRTPATNAPSCGGNYTASNYMDNDTIHGINNATVSATANAVTQFISGSVKDTSGNEIVNDRLLIITRDELFNAIKKRNDFGSTFIPQLFTKATNCLSTASTTTTTTPTLPNPVTIDFSTMSESSGALTPMGMNQLKTGRITSQFKSPIPASCNDIFLSKWRDNLAYATCSSGGQCFSVNGSPCRGIVIFSGERNAAQNRSTNTQKNTWSNYLEGSALNIVTSGATPVTGVPTTYNPASPSSDVWTCIP